MPRTRKTTPVLSRTKRKTTPVLSRTCKQTSARTVRNRGRNQGLLAVEEAVRLHNAVVQGGTLAHGAAEGQCASEQVPDVRMDSVQSYVGGILRSLENERLRGNPAFKKLLKRLAIILVPVITVALASKNKKKIVALLQKLSPQMPRSLSHNRGREREKKPPEEAARKAAEEAERARKEQEEQARKAEEARKAAEEQAQKAAEERAKAEAEAAAALAAKLKAEEEAAAALAGAPSPRSANDLFEAFKTGIYVAYEKLGGDTVFGQLSQDAYLLNLPSNTIYNGIRMKDLEYTSNKKRKRSTSSRSKSSSTTDVSIDVSVENLGGDQFVLSIPKGYQKTVYELKCVHEQQKGVPAYLLQYYREDSEQPLIDNTQLTPGDSLRFLTDHYCKRIGEYKDSICFVCIQITDYWVVTFSGYQEVDWMGEGELRQFPVEKSTWSLSVEGNWREVKPGLARYHLVEWRDHLFYTVGDFIELGEIRGKQWIVLNNLIYFMNNQPDSRLYVIETCDSTTYKSYHLCLGQG